ncbi:glycosyltransferase [Halobacillus sp. A5]|uniref:glycosyltransferase n=1 Tax=Halobacillus sp. A5 TaxID=2880263 RepID=UPI0020A6BB75|nr:glycosyltransferase [Halobacillus sp. A5]MCP3029186.1 glycosyltransferase [Halobacillus sp. A5]
MKRSIVFMVKNMNIGGTEKALLNLLSEMSKDRYDITILLMEEKGEFLTHIPQHVHVEVLKGFSKIKRMINQPPKQTAISLFKEGSVIKALSFSYFYFLSKIFRNKDIYIGYLAKHIRYENKKYDIAVAYAGPMDFISYFILNKVSATKRIQWIHFDVTKIGFNHVNALKSYRSFNKIFVVSKESQQKLKELLPSISNKIFWFPNFISQKVIQNLAEVGSGFQDDFNGIRILTVGRLSREKGQDLIIKVLAKLKRKGIHVKWYCIGEGIERNNYEKLIEHYGLREDFLLLGAKANPYRYMKDCDIYIQPSRHEGFCITLAEAICFNKPIISTKFSGAYEQLVPKRKGEIVDFDEDQLELMILEKIKELKNYQNESVRG